MKHPREKWIEEWVAGDERPVYPECGGRNNDYKVDIWSKGTHRCIGVLELAGSMLPAEREAIVRLITAAPNLVDALQAMLSVSLAVDDYTWAAAVDRKGECRPCDKAKTALDKVGIRKGL